ncbi:dolichyl-diphosphooligosaccharide--protein glycosyltransferase subunit 1 [Coemansia furcata]|uniref:Dolichyl-diphosphooligosaccharide--protein glycosyltransferase subunit 1 n=1 Tax=Coemansia furcata TaxID=417177 RepID=A0ACC1LJZ6_9FUNG|nr:dolichyl-diphosphooligosaccharide--protein glycosyltransferase subunit 1 [Coemansia furcata]
MRVGGLSGLLLCVWAVTVSGSGLVNTNVIRTVDLQKLPFVHEQVGVVVQNDHPSKVFKTYTISIPLDKAPKLSQVTVHERKSGDALAVSKEGVFQDTQQYRVALRRGLQPGEKLSLNIDLLFVSLVEPQPKAVAQSDDQSWLWDDRARVASLYPTRKQKTVVKTRGDVLRFTKENAAKDARTVVFGPFTDDAEGRVQVAIRDNGEQMEAVTHRREYFVSHWADDLNVLEHYALRNLGPELSGGFDKVDQMVSKYMRRRDNLVKTLLVKVPEDARSMYFVDEIGNVSTSAVTGRRRPKGEGEPFKILQLKPRFPLPGGWNYTWWHGYSVPLHRYLKISDGRHLLRLPFIGSLAACASQEGELTVAMANAQNTAVRAYKLRVTLPEGARDISVQLPVAGEPLLVPTKYYFDSVGRTVVVITHANVAPELASRHILVSYSYAPLALWLKPAVVAAALFALFMLASVASRMQYGLTPKRPAAKSKAAKKQSGKAE